MRAGWEEVPEEVFETAAQYCQTVMTTLHLGQEPGWSLPPFEELWED